MNLEKKIFGWKRGNMSPGAKSTSRTNRRDERTESEMVHKIKIDYERQIQHLHKALLANIEERLKLEDANADYKEELDFYKVKCSVAERDCALLSEQNAEHRKEVKRLKNEIEQLRNELSEEKMSRSASTSVEDRLKCAANAYEVFKGD